MKLANQGSAPALRHSQRATPPSGAIFHLQPIWSRALVLPGKAGVSGSFGATWAGARLCVPRELRDVITHSLYSGKNRMYDVIQETIENDFPTFLGKIFAFLANPGLIIPAILLML